MLRLLVQPRASVSCLVGIHNDRLKVRIKAPPIDGRANDEILRFFAALLGLRKNQLKILAGDLGKQKSLLITGIERGELERRLVI